MSLTPHQYYFLSVVLYWLSPSTALRSITKEHDIYIRAATWVGLGFCKQTRFWPKKSDLKPSPHNLTLWKFKYEYISIILSKYLCRNIIFTLFLLFSIQLKLSSLNYPMQPNSTHFNSTQPEFSTRYRGVGLDKSQPLVGLGWNRLG